MKKLILILVLVVVAACKRADKASFEPHSVALDTTAGESAAQRVRNDEGASLPNGKQAAPALSLAATRMIVRTANMRIVVTDTARTVDAVTKAVEAMGGFVAGSNVWQEGTLLRATLTLRVPADKLTTALGAIRGVAKRVEKETLTSDDVSEEFVDLEARVRNLEATEEELRQLLIVARQNSRKATEVLEVHEQLTNIRGQIEQARGRMRYLSQVAAMSSINLDVVPDAIIQPVVEAGWRPAVIAKNATRALVGSLQSIATVLIWFAIYILPMFAMLGLVIFGAKKLATNGKAAG